MKRIWGVVAAVLVSVSLTVVGLSVTGDDDPAVATEGKRHFKAKLMGYEEVPAVSSPGSGRFEAKLDANETTLSYELAYADLQGTASAAHIHLGQKGVAGGVSAFLCGGGGKPACPTTTGTVGGTITAANIIGPTGQGISAGEFGELIEAMRAGVTYANVHSSTQPGGEIRGQIK